MKEIKNGVKKRPWLWWEVVKGTWYFIKSDVTLLVAIMEHVHLEQSKDLDAAVEM